MSALEPGPGSKAGWLGIAVAEVSPAKAKEANLSRAEGVVVERVIEGGPGAKVGLKPGDIITRYNGITVEGTLQFMRMVRETPPGRTAELTIRRDGKEERLSAEVGARRGPTVMTMDNFEPEKMFRGLKFRMPWMSGWSKPLLGIEAEDLSGQLGEYFQVPGGEGVLVEDVTMGSAAEKAGLKAGDVIVAVGGKPAHTVGELREQLRAGCGEKPLRLDIVRKGKPSSLEASVSCPAPPSPPPIPPAPPAQ